MRSDSKSYTKRAHEMRPLFTHLPRPFIVCVIRESDPETVIATMHNAHYDGAQAFDLHISRLDKKYRNHADLRRIMAATACPVLLLHYRNTQESYVSDEERSETLLTGINAGAAGIDMPADFFDPTPEFDPSTFDYRNSEPREISRAEQAIRKQRAFIEKVQSMGAEVLLSSHTRVVMKAEQVVALAKELESRGADIVKIVTVCMNDDDLIEAFRSILALKKELSVPFQYQCHGQHGKLTRVVGPMLGSMLVFCNQQFTAGTFDEQPLVRAMRSVFQNVDWSVSQLIDEESFTNK